jgi:hypothetical protein
LTTPEPLVPDLQILFADRLKQIEKLHLAEALASAVSALQVPDIDADLAKVVPGERLTHLASFGLRGETFFAVPVVLHQDPRLLAYYRLLYGFSQKEFYRRFGRFKSMETKGSIPATEEAQLEKFAISLSESGWILLANLPSVTLETIRDLQLLTLGPQLRGSRLNEIGQAAVATVFRRIRDAVPDSSVESESDTRIALRNSSSRLVVVQFASDPDISITEQLGDGSRPVLAIEIKGGKDVSNIHNRLGEAEKSHLKAKQMGYSEFWTIKNSAVDSRLAARESPTTNHFFDLEDIVNPEHAEWERFRAQLASRLGLPDA